MVRQVVALPLTLQVVRLVLARAVVGFAPLPPAAREGARAPRRRACGAGHARARLRGPRRARAAHRRGAAAGTDRVTRADVPDGGGPLAGLRVIELGTLLAGPFTGRLLGDLGAEIVKVEAPGKPDPIRDWGKARYEGRSLWWPVQSRNKKCITLNLREHARAGAAPAARRARRRRHRELPAGDARALGARVRPPERGEPPRDPGTRVRLRADRAVRASAPGSRRCPRRWAASGT